MRDQPGWYDIDGRPISAEQASELLADIDARRIAYDDIDDERYLSTVLLVLDHGWLGNGPPLIFETMLLPDGDPCVRTSTRHAALAAHDQMLAELRDVAAAATQESAPPARESE